MDDEKAAAARLIERLLTDPALRNRFRSNPVATAREEGLGLTASDLGAMEGRPMQTLDARESRSSLAGALMAAALEGVAIGGLAAGGSIDPARAAVGDEQARLARGVGGPASEGGDPGLARGGGGPASQGGDPGLARGGGGARPEDADELLGPGRRGAGGRAPPGDDLRTRLALQAVRQTDPRARGVDAARGLGGLTPEQAAAARAEREGSRLWAARVAPLDDAPQDQARAAAAAPAAEPAAATAADTPGDPARYGVDGTGGRPGAGTRELLRNHRVSFDAEGIADLRAGRIDPRIVSVLDRLGQRHRLGISVIATGHDQQTAGGSTSNHWYGRAVDIATVDGESVGPGSKAARRLVDELTHLDPKIRPTELGSPWPISFPGSFSDAAHQNHIHVGFDDPVPRGWVAPGVEATPVSSPAGGAAADELSSDDLQDDDAIDADDGGDVDSEDAVTGGESDDDDGETDDDDDEDDEDDDEDDEDEDEDEDDDEDEEDDDDAGDRDSDDDEDDEDDDDDDEDDDDEDDDDGGGEDSVDSADEDDDDSDDDDSDDDALQDQGGPAELGGRVPDVVSAFPGDSAPREQIAEWMAARARSRGLPGELPVMASLVESNLRNVGYGDADSVGFFQMRVGIWNKGEYAGYPDRPERQLDWFLDHALAIKKERLSKGLSVDDPKDFGDWVADVEQPASAYRGRYQLRLSEARELLERSGHSRRGGPAADLIAEAGGQVPGRRAVAALAEAKRALGTPYLWGGSTPKTGFDCSGLVQWAYAKVGIKIPRVTDQQILASNGTPVPRKRLLPGDLVFFRDPGGYVHHVGISLGGDKFIHAPHTGDVVKVSSLKDSYYADQFTGGRRFDAPGVAEARRGADDPAEAQASLMRDADEAQRPGTLIFRALTRQESLWESHVMPAVKAQGS